MQLNLNMRAQSLVLTIIILFLLIISPVFVKAAERYSLDTFFALSRRALTECCAEYKKSFLANGEQHLDISPVLHKLFLHITALKKSEVPEWQEKALSSCAVAIANLIINLEISTDIVIQITPAGSAERADGLLEVNKEIQESVNFIYDFLESSGLIAGTQSEFMDGFNALAYANGGPQCIYYLIEQDEPEANTESGQNIGEIQNGYQSEAIEQNRNEIQRDLRKEKEEIERNLNEIMKGLDEIRE